MAKTKPETETQEAQTQDVTGTVREYAAMYGEQGLELAATRSRVKELEVQNAELKQQLVANSASTNQ